MRRTRAVLLAALVVFSVFGGVAGTAFADGSETGNNAVNYGADVAHNPQTEVDVTKAKHEVGWSAQKYEDDSGSLSMLAANVNESVNNPYSFTLTDVNASDFHQFPHSKENVDALDAGEWTTSSSATATNVETAPNVEAVELSISDGNYTKFSNFSVTSDESKRFLQLGLDVKSIDAGTTLEFKIKDEDGDYKTAEINTSRSSGEDYITNATGEGIFYQVQLGTLTTEGSGDGTFDNIQAVNVSASGGAATVEISAFNLEKMSKYKLGSKLVDNDDDDELESVSIYEVKTGGDISVSSVTTLGSTFDNAVIHDLTMPMHFEAKLVQDDRVQVEFKNASNFPSFDYRANVYYKLELPDAYDLSYANAELTDQVEVPGSRYQTVEYAEGVGDTAFSDIDDSSWTSISGQYDSQGANVTIDSTIQPGQTIAIHYDYTITSEEKSALEVASKNARQFEKEGGGGLADMIFSPIGGIIGALSVFGIYRVAR